MVRLADIAAVGQQRRSGIRDWIPIRHELGIRSFGINAFVAPHAGDVLVERHTELGEMSGNHEELYFVVSGIAVFDVGGEEIRAEAGTLLFVSHPTTPRAAVADADGTTVLAIGANVGAPYRASEWERTTIARFGRREE